jgi:hypothetical protein
MTTRSPLMCFKTASVTSRRTSRRCRPVAAGRRRSLGTAFRPGLVERGLRLRPAGERGAQEPWTRAITLARHSIQAMQHDEDVLKSGRAQYADDPHWLIAASHVIAVEFATIAAANRNASELAASSYSRKLVTA